MASPVVESVAESANPTTAATSHTVDLPGSIAAGDLLIWIADKGSTAATINAITGWTELLDENSANGLFIAWRKADGTEGANITATTSASTRLASMVYRISGAADPTVTAPGIGTTGTGTSATPDPPSVSPPSSKDYLFIAFAGMAGEEADDDTWGNTPPTNYTPSPPRQKSCGTVGTNLGGLLIAAERQLTTGSAENPGTFGVDVSAAWRSQTIIVHPAPPPKSTSIAKISLADAGNPSEQTHHKLHVRARIQSGAGQLKIALYEGANNRSGDLTTGPLTTSLADYTVSIADASAANITSYANLDVWFWGYSTDGNAGVYEVDQVWLELPASVGAGDTAPPGGATAGGVAPTAAAAVPQGGAPAAGPNQSARVSVPQGGASSGGPAPMARVAVPPGGAVAGGTAPHPPLSETPTPGGAVAGGVGPSARATSSAGGAVAAGTAPTARIATPQGGAAAAGNGPAARVSVTPGGAVAGGRAPGESIPGGDNVPPGGAVASGVAPTAVVSVSPGGAVTGGNAPSESTSLSQTPTPGGAIAAGVGPTARVSATIGGAVAAGTAPSPRATTTAGGAAAAGTAPTVRVSLTIGGAIAGGRAPGETVSGGDLVPSGGAVAGGNSPTVRVPSSRGGAPAAGTPPLAYAFQIPVPGGAIAGGRAPSGALVSVSAGGAIADGFDAGAPLLLTQGVLVGFLGRSGGGFISTGRNGSAGDDLDRSSGGFIPSGRNGRIDEVEVKR